MNEEKRKRGLQMGISETELISRIPRDPEVDIHWLACMLDTFEASINPIIRDEYNKFTMEAIELLKDFQAKLEQHCWVPQRYGKKLPKKEQPILFLTPHGRVIAGHYGLFGAIRGCKFRNETEWFGLEEVTHWKPIILPEGSE